MGSHNHDSVTTVIKTVLYWQKNRQFYQWKKKRAQKEIYTNIVNSSLTKKQRQIVGERIIFSTHSSGTTAHPHAKKKKNRHRPYAFHEKNN